MSHVQEEPTCHCPGRRCHAKQLSLGLVRPWTRILATEKPGLPSCWFPFLMGFVHACPLLRFRTSFLQFTAGFFGFPHRFLQRKYPSCSRLQGGPPQTPSARLVADRILPSVKSPQKRVLLCPRKWIEHPAQWRVSLVWVISKSKLPFLGQLQKGNTSFGDKR